MFKHPASFKGFITFIGVAYVSFMFNHSAYFKGFITFTGVAYV